MVKLVNIPLSEQDKETIKTIAELRKISAAKFLRSVIEEKVKEIPILPKNSES